MQCLRVVSLLLLTSAALVVATSKDDQASLLSSSGNALIPTPSAIALASAITPELSSDSAYNRDIVAKHRAFRVYADIDFQYTCRDRINRKRRWHESTPDLDVNFNITKYTIERAHSILRDIENKQDITKGRYALGESFFWYYDPNRYRTVDDAIDTWYGEYRNYDYNRPGFSAKTGGFTQLVWKRSREVSCAKIDYETRDHYKTLFVCNYYPAGNVQGEFPYNVMPLRKGGNRPDQDQDNDYPSRPSRPENSRPNRPSRPDYPDRPSRPDYDPRPPSRPDSDRPNRPSRPDYPPDRPSRPENDRPSRPDYDPRPPNRPEYDPRPPSRPERPDYDPRPPGRPDRPRPPYDEDRPSRPGGGGGSGSGSNANYPTHPVQVTGSQTIISGDKADRKPTLMPLDPLIQSASPAVVIPEAAPAVEPTPVQYAPAVIAPQTPAGAGGQVVYEPVEAVLILPQYGPSVVQQQQQPVVGGGVPLKPPMAA